jgi:hypothetical protein
MRFSLDSARPVGHVFILPHREVPSSDQKDRGYVLLNRCTPPSQATLAYRSSQHTEAANHSPVLPVGEQAPSPWNRQHARRGGSTAPRSYVYPTRLVYWDSSRLAQSGDVVKNTKGLRTAIAQSLGLVPAADAALGELPVSGYRGRLLRLSDAGTRRLAFRWGVILTAARYSMERRWQVVVPIFAPGRALAPHDVQLGSKSPWLAAINPAWTDAILSCTLVCSVSHLDGQVDTILTESVDDPTLQATEQMLRARFGLS